VETKGGAGGTRRRINGCSIRVRVVSVGIHSRGLFSLNTKVGDEMRRYGMRGRKQ
jgi:hypothetical protein